MTVNLFMLLVPLANKLLRLHPVRGQQDASNTSLHGVLTELSLKTTRHGIKYLTLLERIASLSSLGKLSR